MSARLTFSRSSIAPASSCRSCGNVSAAARIFPPPRLLIQEPRGEQGQGLVTMPCGPRPHLIVAQPGLPLGTLEALLDPMRRPAHPRQLLQGRLGIGVGEVIVMLERPVMLPLAGDEQQFL